MTVIAVRGERMGAEATTQASGPRRSALFAVVLQCIPLLGAASCFAYGTSDQKAGGAGLLWFAVLLWGLGYAYLGRWRRFVAVLLLGPVFAFTSCVASFSGVRYDFEHPYENTVSEVESANRASFQEGLIISAAVLLLAVDAWRLAAARNAEAAGDRREDQARET